jgi:sulfoxide reductase heme-binding subunit YedZ
LPFLLLCARVALDLLGADPVRTLTLTTGLWTLRLLLLTLAFAPLVKYTGWKVLYRFRRMVALYCFFYACLHLLVYLLFEHAFILREIARDVVRHPYVLAGMTAYLCLVPLAITSTNAWMRRLGAAWKKLHRLVYVAGTAACLHFLWSVKADYTEPLLYTSFYVALVLPRLAAVVKRKG